MARGRPRAVKHPAALKDILDHADYLAEQASLAVATRFVKATEQTISRLATMPRVGSLWDSEHPRLADMRFSPIGKFRNHLVFYRPISGGGVEVVRVLHGAQDIDAIFDEER
jgi:plasmid stabilization system protein ParE